MSFDESIQSFFPDFQMMSISATERLRHMAEADSTLSRVQLPYWELQSVLLSGDTCTRQSCLQIFEHLSMIDEESLYRLVEEYRRLSLIASITILDTFLSDLLKFLFLVRPDSMPKKYVEKGRDDLNEAVERAVKEASFGGYGRRLKQLSDLFDLEIELEELLGKIHDLSRLRNDIAHDSALYEYKHDQKLNRLMVRAKPLVAVDYRMSMNANMIVTELVDALYMAICHKIFRRDPDVRPLTPSVAAVHKKLRAEWESLDRIENDVKVINAGWLVMESRDPESASKRYYVTDSESVFFIQPVGIDRMPIMVSYLKHKYHGKWACVSIDEHAPISLESSAISNSRELLGHMLNGKILRVEYYCWPSQSKLIATYSLDGFAAAWADANGKTPKVAAE